MADANSPIYSPFFGVMGAASAIIFSALGAAYGTAKSGTGIAAMSVMRPELIMKSIIPVVMAGIIAIYGLVIAVLIAGAVNEPPNYSLYKGFIHLGAGLAVGFSGLAAGFAIGIVGDAGVRGTAQQPRLFVGMILILIFAEVLDNRVWRSGGGELAKCCRNAEMLQHGDVVSAPAPNPKLPKPSDVSFVNINVMDLVASTEVYQVADMAACTVV